MCVHTIICIYVVSFDADVHATNGEFVVTVSSALALSCVRAHDYMHRYSRRAHHFHSFVCTYFAIPNMHMCTDTCMHAFSALSNMYLHMKTCLHAFSALSHMHTQAHTHIHAFSARECTHTEYIKQCVQRYDGQKGYIYIYVCVCCVCVYT